MATKKAREKKRLVEGETPITIGGGGGGPAKAPIPLRIDYDAGAWVASVPPGTLTLVGGRVKKMIISTDDFDLKLPVNGSVSISLKCGKPVPPPLKRRRR